MKIKNAIAWFISVSLVFPSSLAYTQGPPRMEISPAFKARLDPLGMKLRSIEASLSRIESQKVIGEGAAELLERTMYDYAQALKAAFDAANQDADKAAKSQGKMGSVEHLRSFEATAKAHEVRVKGIEARTKGIEAQLKTGAIKLDRPLLLKMTPAERHEFRQFLAPPALQEMERLHPDLMRPGMRQPGSSLNPVDGKKVAGAVTGFCSVLPEQFSNFLVSPAEAAIAAGCAGPCLSFNWPACVTCVVAAGSSGVNAWNSFVSCWNGQCGCRWYKPWCCAAKVACLVAFVGKLA